MPSLFDDERNSSLMERDVERDIEKDERDAFFDALDSRDESLEREKDMPEVDIDRDDDRGKVAIARETIDRMENRDKANSGYDNLGIYMSGREGSK